MNLLDNDLYNFTMSYFAFANGYSYLPVTYELINRGTENLAAEIDINLLAHKLEHLQTLRFTEDELSYLYSLRIFPADYISLLRYDFEPPVLSLEANTDISTDISLTYTGPWVFSIFYETIILALINELYFQDSDPLSDLDLLAAANTNLSHKIGLLKVHPEVKILEFGTRRRRSREWQEYILTQLLTNCPDNIVGTSNLRFARRYKINPVGTIAHQIFMVLGEETIPDALMDWEQTFVGHPELLTLLPDTYTTKRFFENVNPECYRNYKTVRVDSGDPFTIGDYILDYYQKTLGFMPRLIFSDSLNISTILELQDYFGYHVLGYGWGTDLTNDVDGRTLQVVIKPCKVGNRKCYKISDDPGKTR